MKNSAHQFAQLRSQLISAFIFRSMDSMILLDFYIRNFNSLDNICMSVVSYRTGNSGKHIFL